MMSKHASQGSGPGLPRKWRAITPSPLFRAGPAAHDEAARVMTPLKQPPCFTRPPHR